MYESTCTYIHTYLLGDVRPASGPRRFRPDGGKRVPDAIRAIGLAVRRDEFIAEHEANRLHSCSKEELVGLLAFLLADHVGDWTKLMRDLPMVIVVVDGVCAKGDEWPRVVQDFEGAIGLKGNPLSPGLAGAEEVLQ
jgi:hypothetical protein